MNRRLAGRSLLRDEPRRLLWLAGVSVALWTFFEALNWARVKWMYTVPGFESLKVSRSTVIDGKGSLCDQAT